jgi:5-methylcytosine-specific restriction endonuclease McrA
VSVPNSLTMKTDIPFFQEQQSVHQRSRKQIPRTLQVAVFRRDRWLCRWCKKPVIFGPAMKYLQHDLATSGYGKLAYWSTAFNRRDSPLLDALAAAIDHVKPFSIGGTNDFENLVTACNKCNTSKNNTDLDKWQRKNPVKPIKGKFGEPENWDGLSNLFLLLAARYPSIRVATETDWLEALTK